MLKNIETKATGCFDEAQNARVLDIGHEKTCNCPSNHINCLSAKEWIQSQVAIWEFSYEKRDIRDKNIHPAVFPIGLPAKCIKVHSNDC